MIRKIIRILTPGDRRKIITLICVNITSSFAGLGGIASLIPFISVLANPASVQSNKKMNLVYNFFGFNNVNRFIVYMGMILLVIFLLSNIILALSNWYNIRFTRRVSNNLSCSLLNLYLSNDYQFFLRRNSSELVKNMFSEVGSVVAQTIKPGIDLISKGFLSLAIVFFLVLISPATAFFAVGLLGGLYGVIYFFLRKKLSMAGKKSVIANAMRFKVTGEAFGGIKDVKLLGKENIYLSRFVNAANEFEKHQAAVTTISQLPKYVLETVAFGGVLAVALSLFVINSDISNVLPLVALYTFAGYRLMPSLETVFKSLTTIRGNAASLDLLYRDVAGKLLKIKKIREIQAAGVEPIKFEKAIELQNVGFSYEGTSLPVLNNINLTININSVIGFVGTTGCGKTTIVDIILALLRPIEGRVLIDGVELNAGNVRNWQKRLGYVAQQIFLADETVTRNIAFGIDDKKIDMDALTRSAKIANIHDFIISELPRGYDTVVGERGIRLSGGQRQRIGIARALYHNPDVLVFDEATSALDNITEAAVMEALDKLMGTKTIILIAHRLSTVKKCDTILFMENGRIKASGNYNELLEQSEDFREVASMA